MINTVRKVKKDFIDLQLDHPVDVWDYVNSLNPHNNTKETLCAYVIARMGTFEDNGDWRFNMPATCDVMEVLRTNKSSFKKELGI